MRNVYICGMGKSFTTRQAFEEMILERAIHKKLGISSNAVRSLRHALGSCQPVSSDYMEELLEKAGWVVKQEKLWAAPAQEKK